MKSINKQGFPSIVIESLCLHCAILMDETLWIFYFLNCSFVWFELKSMQITIHFINICIYYSDWLIGSLCWGKFCVKNGKWKCFMNHAWRVVDNKLEKSKALIFHEQQLTKKQTFSTKLDTAVNKYANKSNRYFRYVIELKSY